ncbi:unnamed protein product [Rotaria sp. Silwood2]|nr:unnamed protein product [Rotaria sp. Silwood2]CAF3090012.1 unnamed protein product [Rotaria sp. Silwood2]CAF3371475.1 unnamed protein product [Rotaria sp. Silwood2]CAF4058630.1 unnamed protein product [Rotaria sp. Silwood2]CAF4190148.1 unnamed protein product [Rotaria sp. Silwood2]
MQVATLSYQSNPKENFHNDPRLTFQHRHILTTITSPQKKQKQRRPPLSDVSINSNNHLPSVKIYQKRPGSIYVKGNRLTSSKLNDISTVSKLNDTSTTSFHQPSRARSQVSDINDISRIRSRSVTPPGTRRSSSKFVRVKFGYPVTIRSPDFYAPSLSNAELRFREESFISDSIRYAHQSSQSSFISPYEAFDDPSLTHFFQSPVVLDVIRKTLNIDLRERSSANHRDNDYHRIVAKPSSGYSKLNGYDCIPPSAPARHRRFISHDKYRLSANSSLTSVPTYSSIHFQQKRSSRLNNKSKLSAPIAASSPLRHTTEAASDIAPASSVSQE